MRKKMNRFKKGWIIGKIEGKVFIFFIKNICYGACFSDLIHDSSEYMNSYCILLSRSTHKPLYNMDHYKKVLDKMRKDGSQKCIDYINGPFSV